MDHWAGIYRALPPHEQFAPQNLSSGKLRDAVTIPPRIDSGMDGGGTCGWGHKWMVSKGAFVVRP